jgi:hypothetical protein
MSERYYITGVQLGMLVAGKKSQRIKLMKETINNQFIENNNCKIPIGFATRDIKKGEMMYLKDLNTKGIISISKKVI